MSVSRFMSSSVPSLSADESERALTEIYERFTEPTNRAKLQSLVQECNQAENPLVAKMQRFPPLVTTIVKDLMAKYGFPEAQMMQGMTQIQMQAARNPAMQHKVGVLMQAFMGNLPEEEGTEEAEECD